MEWRGLRAREGRRERTFDGGSDLIRDFHREVFGGIVVILLVLQHAKHDLFDALLHLRRVEPKLVETDANTARARAAQDGKCVQQPVSRRSPCLFLNKHSLYRFKRLVRPL